ncbi:MULTISPECIES: hypothetical protein [unclassified Paenibacillus]|uniref:phage neck terminator protein n=1 Tax=unclassified Paenibacillus TaxID=185978 RepID=UPI0009571BCF|nr:MULTISPECIES: hypothetical protein [unclassified Paenibacillus]ASS66378.1 hypothetical protein CIC07_09600 [Paenibacillus sp. RUD330]SIQ06257.1 hypothetical protein SAMN05880555_0501 [Paenibacillus sp. RU4X]SIQ26389.1 hypothetical protein SAMN05880570_0500 [Paenibacillus sp. RU4T]
MLPYLEIRSAIARGLKAALAVPVIDLNSGGPVPTGAFMTYDFDGFGSESAAGQPVIRQTASQRIAEEPALITVSLMSYADPRSVALTQALQARDWLKTAGRDALKALDVVVVRVEDVQNRDINIGEEWERRYGFDAELRATDRITTELYWIEQAKPHEE